MKNKKPATKFEEFMKANPEFEVVAVTLKSGVRITKYRGKEE